ncbi:MAG: transposase [Candidatus Binatia bacterium]
MLGPAAELARELGVPRNRLYKWQEQVRKKGSAAFPGQGLGGSNDELTGLRGGLGRLTEELGS